MRINPETTFEKWALNMPRAELGGLIKEYIAESNHQGWDGFSPHDLTGIRKFLADIMIYRDNYDSPGETGSAAKKLATHINNVNPVP